MNILLLTPGTGNFHCGSCLRDHALVRALRAQGHEAQLVPMYLPQVFDHPSEDGAGRGVFFGGVNVYLQQKLGVFRKTPRWIDVLLDRPALLRKSADWTGMTRANDLGEITLSMLAGEHGRQVKELERLVQWIEKTAAPDVVCLNNALLLGLARQLKMRLKVPIVCTLHGEDEFIDSLPVHLRDKTWQQLATRIQDADALIAVSHYYAAAFGKRVPVDKQRLYVVYNGIPMEGLEPAPRPPVRPTIGFLARLRQAKGLGQLTEAFIRLKQQAATRDARLCVVGSQTPADRAFVKSIQSKFSRAGVADDVEWHVNVSRAQKADLLRSMSVLSVPAAYGEAFGLYLLEAWACGVPVVQPRRGAFVELLDQSQAGILYDPDDAGAQAKALTKLLNDPDAAAAMGRRGRQSVLDRFTDEHMAHGILSVLNQVVHEPSHRHGL